MQTEERVGEAWRLHRQGDHQGAIVLFRDILTMTPDNVDAQYGLSLALRANGNRNDAVAGFQRCLQLTRKALDAVKLESKVEGHHGDNNLSTYADDRYMMLNRMIAQRLFEMGATTSA
jgi:tetratricopeptide (TPR) repeat protein